MASGFDVSRVSSPTQMSSRMVLLKLFALMLYIHTGKGQMCPFGWVERPGSDQCYLLQATSTRYRFEEATAKCQAYGGDMLMISSTQEKDWVMNELGKITAAFPSVRMWWLGMRWASDRYTWVDNTTVNNHLVPWEPGLPGNTKGPCVAIKGQEASDVSCGIWLNIICTRNKSLPLTCDVDSQWHYVSGSCLKTFLDQRTWADAKSLCELQNGQLASVTTFEQHAHLWDAAHTIIPPTSVWTGLHVVQQQSGQLQLAWLDGPLQSSGETFWMNETDLSSMQPGSSMVINGTVQRRLKSWSLDNDTSLHAYACQRPEGVCENGWLTHQNTCFKFFDLRVQWTGARSFCKATGGQLVNLASATDQMLVQRYLPEFAAMGYTSFWIGISDEGNDQGPFMWTDGRQIGNASHWVQDPPPTNTAGNMDCGYISTDDAEGRWQMTSDCLQPRTFMCSIPVNVPVQQVKMTTAASGLQCETGWTRSPNNRCWYFADRLMSWQGAQGFCVDLGGHLAIIRDQEDQAFIDGVISGTDYWMGMSDLHGEGTWRWVDNNTVSGFLNWAPEEPNSLGGEEDCGSLWGTRGQSMLGLWNDKHCDTQQQFICEKEPIISPTTPADSTTTTTTSRPVVYSAKCGVNWDERPNSDYCYQFHDEVRSQPEALSECRNQSGSLVSIVDHIEQNYLAGRAQSMDVGAVWTGATDSALEGGWTWLDGAPFAYFNWNPGKPNNNDNAHCAAMLTKSSRWNDLPCQLALGFICKKLADTYATTSRPSTTPLPEGKYWNCPKGYIAYRENCYVTHTSLKTWADAQRMCRAEGGDLASLSDQQENDFLFSMLPNDLSNLTGSWLGLSEVGQRGWFRWSDNTPVTFSTWHTGMPLPFPEPSCVLITKTDGGSWVNAPCDGVAKYVCKRPMIIDTATSLSPYRVGCPLHSMGYEAWCYTTVEKPMTWNQAEQFCSLSHGHLATISSLSVQSFVASELDRSAGQLYWVGLTDQSTPGTFTWSSGDPVVFTAWASGLSGNEQGRCAGMQTTHPLGLWQKGDCGTQQPFVCRYPRRGFTSPTLPATSTTPLPTTPTSCPDGGWSGFGDNCYKAVTETNNRKSWTDARDACRGFGGDLASIHSNDLLEFLHDNLLRGVSYSGANYWIGLTVADVESTYMWSDGSPVQFFKWNREEPNNADGNEDCVEYNIFTNGWNDNHCSILNPFICALPRGTPLRTTLQPKTTTQVPRCDGTDWLAKDGYCYYVSPLFGTDSRKTWFQARRFCQQNGADLASILSEGVNSFLTQYVTQQQVTLRQYWIGFTKLGLDSFEWTDKSPVVFSSWEASEPNDAFGGQMCVNLYSILGKWFDDNCNDEYHFICKRNNGSVKLQPPIPTPLIRGGCPPLFSGVGNKCFYLGGLNASTALNYTAARDACRAMTSRTPVDIASITNHQEQAFVMTLLEGVKDWAFLGLNDQNSNGHFVWQNNEEVTVTYWAPNQPGQTWGHYGTVEEDCVVMRTEESIFGLWDDTYCGNLHAYVCQTMKDVHYPMISLSTAGCRQDHVYYRDSCYATYKMPQTWDQAESTCVRDLGHLVSLRDIHELAKVSLFVYENVIVRPVWIGLSIDERTHDFSWVDGWPVLMTSWAEGEPSRPSNRSCVILQDGLWKDTSCDEHYPFVCKMSSVSPPPTTQPPPGYCKNPSWAQHGAFCYYADPMNKRSWPEANYLCRQQGMELLSLHDAGEQMFVQSLVNLAVTTSPYSYRQESSHVWLGLQRTADGGFRWSDDSPFDYYDWNKGEPNNHDSVEQCAELLVDSGKWNDITCISDSALGDRGFVCKTPKIILTTSTTAITSTTMMTRTTQPAYSTMADVHSRATETQGHTAKSTDGGRATLSGGEIAGIVIGLLAFIVITGAVVFIIRNRTVVVTKTLRSVETASGFENALYAMGDNKEEVTLSFNGSASAPVTSDSNP